MSINEKNREGKKQRLCVATFVVCLITSIGLVVGGFMVPPLGVIDGSVLKAVGELLVFPTIAYGYRAIEMGLDVKMTKGDAMIEINCDTDEND